MKLHERAEMIRSMEKIVRSVNNEEIFGLWLSLGVADGDINGKETDEDLDFYAENENLSDLMALFLETMEMAKEDGGLFFDGVLSR